jgi:hypothetical protein
MKKVLSVFILFLMFATYSNSQEINYLGHAAGTHYIYAGSLAKTSTNSYQKLKIEVFGGAFWASSLGTTTYSIGTRDVNSINIERTGGLAAYFELVAYENGNSYDFVIQTTAQYTSLNIRATYLDVYYTQYNSIAPKQEVNIKKYDPTGKRNATSDFTETIMTATDRYGNFGIGTLTPQAKLDVRGKIIADEVEVKVNKAPDFVFFPDYNLRPLSEVESFVKENKHLPEIPSEKEMQENGLNLNDMQMKLLQKVEELTMYVIGQQKEIESLKQEIKELKQE